MDLRENLRRSIDFKEKPRTSTNHKETSRAGPDKKDKSRKSVDRSEKAYIGAEIPEKARNSIDRSVTNHVRLSNEIDFLLSFFVLSLQNDVILKVMFSKRRRFRGTTRANTKKDSREARSMSNVLMSVVLC